MSVTPPATPRSTEPAREPSWLVDGSTLFGLAAAAFGVIVGVVMMGKQRETPCKDGTYFPEGTTDFRCFEHPQLLLGSAVLLICVALGALLILCGAILKSVEAPTATRAGAGASPAEGAQAEA